MPPGAEHNPVIRGLYPERFHDPQMQVVNQPGADLPRNPNAEPSFDRTRPYPPGIAAERLGFQNQEGRLFDLPRGDGGAGQTSFRRIQTFVRLDDPATLSVAGNPAFRPLPLATQRASDQRLRFWHVSFFGTGIISEEVAPRSPLAESEILQNAWFVGVEQTAGAVLSSLVPYIPRISSLQARAMIHDEQGQRFLDLDVIGTRSFDVYAWSVTVFLLVPIEGYEVTTGSLLKNPDNNRQLQGLVEDSIVAARVVPIALNSTNNTDQRTISVDFSGNAGPAAKVPIPPGAKTVTVISHGTAAANLLYRMDFDVGGPVATAAVTTMGAIVIDPVSFRTNAIRIPNSTKIAVAALAGAAPTSFSFVFEINS